MPVNEALNQINGQHQFHHQLIQNVNNPGGPNIKTTDEVGTGTGTEGSMGAPSEMELTEMKPALNGREGNSSGGTTTSTMINQHHPLTHNHHSFHDHQSISLYQLHNHNHLLAQQHQQHVNEEEEGNDHQSNHKNNNTHNEHEQAQFNQLNNNNHQLDQQQLQQQQHSHQLNQLGHPYHHLGPFSHHHHLSSEDASECRRGGSTPRIRTSGDGSDIGSTATDGPMEDSSMPPPPDSPNGQTIDQQQQQEQDEHGHHR